MSSNDTWLVIKVENRQPINNPITYSNFLQLHPACPVQQIPTNNVIGPFGYELFEHSQQPSIGIFEHPPTRQEIYICREDGVWTDTWQTNPFNQQEIDTRIEQEWTTIKRKRFLRLLATDWTQFTNIPLPPEELTNWNIYRQALRDVPQNNIDPFDITWPAIPYPTKIDFTQPD